MRHFVPLIASALVGCAIHPYSGRVIDAQGRPVAKAYIQGWHCEDSRTKLLIVATETDASGHFTLPTYTFLHELTVWGPHDEHSLPCCIQDVPKPKFVDNLIVLKKNVKGPKYIP